MIFNTHFRLEGKHALLSPSNYHWVNYSDEKLKDLYRGLRSKEHGTRVHEWAAEAIALGMKQEENTTKTVANYINDCIGFGMTPEQVLYYSDNIFGTADAISFRIEPMESVDKPMLRISDLKTGKTKADMKQLMLYAALFCLEYKIKPKTIITELRIYQNDMITAERPLAKDIEHYMRIIKNVDKVIHNMQMGVTI